MEICALPAGHRRYTYTLGRQISEKTGFIGILQGDFVTYEFESAWWEDGRNGELMTQEFRAELNQVVDELRESGFLRSRAAVIQFMRSYRDACWKGSCTEMAAVRADTDRYAFLFRLVPVMDYNVFIYCYLKSSLDKHLTDAEKGIRILYSNYQTRFHIADGDMIRVTRNDGSDQNYTLQYIDEDNVMFGTKPYSLIELAELLESKETKEVIPLRSSLPERCYTTFKETGKILSIKKGETVCYEAHYAASGPEEARHIVAMLNSSLGVTKAQEAAMTAGAMLGFAAPAADPANYDENGNPKGDM